MIQNIKKYAEMKGLNLQDALQVFMQVVVLKNLQLDGAYLIGGTSLVLRGGNPRFSEDIDLSGVADPKNLRPYIDRAAAELNAYLETTSKITPPKEGGATWKIACVTADQSARLHIDSQPYKVFTSSPIMVEYPGIAPFVFPSVKLEEVIADKLIAVAFRNNLSGRDIFDIYYHWIRHGLDSLARPAITELIIKKLKQRKLSTNDFNKNISERLKETPPHRVVDEWERYLPPTLKSKELYREMFEQVRSALTGFKL